MKCGLDEYSIIAILNLWSNPKDYWNSLAKLTTREALLENLVHNFNRFSPDCKLSIHSAKVPAGPHMTTVFVEQKPAWRVGGGFINVHIPGAEPDESKL